MRFILLCVAFLSASAAVAEAPADKPAPIRLLVITGGHPFDPRFYALFENQEGIEWDKKTQTSNPCAAYTPGFADAYDVVLLYDFVFKISEEQKKAFEDAFGDGRGLIVLHHALCSHPEWPKYREMVGGQFLFNARDGLVKSQFTGGIKMTYVPAKPEHPITLGLEPITIVEEPYKYVYMAPDNEPLLVSDNEESDRVVAWTRKYKDSRIACIVPGHGGDIFVDSNYRKLMAQAVAWAAGREAVSK